MDTSVTIVVTHMYRPSSITVGELRFVVELLHNEGSPISNPYTLEWTVSCNELASEPSNGFSGQSRWAKGATQKKAIKNLIAVLYKELDDQDE